MREKSLIKDLTTKVTVTTKIQFFLNTKRKSFKWNNKEYTSPREINMENIHNYKMLSQDWDQKY
jgi:hypothetical protein